MKRVVVLASGGFDSTYLMLQYLQHEHFVIPLYVDTSIHDNQKKAEKKALHYVTSYLHQRWPHLIDCHYESIELPWHYAKECNLQQPQVWVTGAFLWTQDKVGRSYKIDEIALGYIIGDHAVSYLSEIRNLYNAFNKFVHSYTNGPCCIPRLVFPMIQLNKETIFGDLHNEHGDLYKHCVYCETPQEDLSPCGHCHSCRTAREAGYLYAPKRPERTWEKWTDVFGEAKSHNQLELDFEDSL